MARSIARRLKFIAGLAVTIFILVWFGRVLLAFHQDKVWAFKVRGKLNADATRQWALNTRQFYSPTNDYRMFETWLTNAPKVLVENYRRPPMVLAQDFGDGTYCVSLRYGGGMYDWGVTIGDTNLPLTLGRGRHVEPWAPGINFWSN